MTNKDIYEYVQTDLVWLFAFLWLYAPNLTAGIIAFARFYVVLFIVCIPIKCGVEVWRKLKKADAREARKAKTDHWTKDTIDAHLQAYMKKASQ